MSDLDALRVLYAKVKAWRCTGDEMRCADGNGCECSMRGDELPPVKPIIDAFPAMADEVDRLRAFAGAVSAHMDDLARCASIFRENGMSETADETEKAVSELRAALNRRDGGSDGG